MSDRRTEKLPAEDVKRPAPSGQPGARWGSFGQPAEKPKEFGNTTRRLFRRLRGERIIIAIAILMGTCAVCMSVVLPKILGSGTDVVVHGVFTHQAIDFSHLGRLLGIAFALLAGSWVLYYSMSYILAGAVQRTMYTLRCDVEAKLNRLSLGYVDRTPRGDMLSRVTNDVDNIAQSLQQTMSQMLTQSLMLVGTVVMMIYISWLLALIAIVTIPLSMFLMNTI
ncbi:MAG TPA: ABC transporter transmembrane domain-containing protein, partial [Dehalococcoidia bacterium]